MEVGPASGEPPVPPAVPRARRRVVVAAACIGAALLAGAIWFLVAGGSESTSAARTSTTSGRGPSGAGGPSGAVGPGGSGATGPASNTGSGGRRPGGATGGATGGTGTTPDEPADPEPEADRIRVGIDPDGCRWSADTLDLTARGAIVNGNTVDVVVEVEISFVDDTGEIDVASDLQVLAPGEEALWDVLGASIDPPRGSLRCVADVIL